MQKFINRFEKGSIYAITSKPGVGKTSFCLNLLSYITQNNGDVLFLTDSLEISKIDDYITQLPTTSQNRIYFKQVFNLHKDKLNTYLNERKYKFLILDPFDNYAYDIDYGELKEIAITNNIIVILTKNLSKPPINSHRTHPTLSDIKFPDKKIQQKFIAYTNMILYLEKDLDTNNFKLIVGKDICGEIGESILIEDNCNF